MLLELSIRGKIRYQITVFLFTHNTNCQEILFMYENRILESHEPVSQNTNVVIKYCRDLGSTEDLFPVNAYLPLQLHAEAQM